MHNLKSGNVEITDMYIVMRIYSMKVNGWDPGIFLLRKAIWHGLVKALATDIVCINIDVAKTAVWAQVINATHVVIVRVGDENTVNSPEFLLQHLLAEIRTAVNKYAGIFSFQKG